MSSRAPMDSRPMLNAYPDSLGGTLSQLVDFLERPEVRGAFSSLYLLPSVFHSDLDRGFSIIDYGLNRLLARPQDLDRLRALGVSLKLDFVLNHASVLSPQFQDLLARGEESPYRDFFVDWNRFWEGQGTMTAEGYVQPDPEALGAMVFRKPGLPLLMVRFPDGREVPYWNTFYQEVHYPVPEVTELMGAVGLQYGEAQALRTLLVDALSRGQRPHDLVLGPLEPYRPRLVEWLEAHRSYLGQMDLNIDSPLVWDFYQNTLETLADYGAEVVRLDAFAYAPKEPGTRNFLNDPGTWDLLQRVDDLARPLGLTLLPEIHSRHAEGIHRTIGEKGYPTYDFFLPGLLIDALERGTNEVLLRWMNEVRAQGLRTIHMLGCHDGIPLLDLQGLLPDDQIQALIDTVVARGGFVKDLHGQKNTYYQVNATYFSALGEDEAKFLLARAIQLFVPGKPQIWYLDLFAGRNDRAAVERAGTGGHKEINRTNLSREAIEVGLNLDVVKRQLELIRFRNECPAFDWDADFQILPSPTHELKLEWRHQGHWARLDADLRTKRYQIEARSGNQTWSFHHHPQPLKETPRAPA